mgnify:CR=1 FL=1
MRKKQIQCLAAFLLIGATIAAPLYGQGNIENEAQALFEQKKYKECIELLEKEIKKPDASLTVIRLAMNANLRIGNPMSASILASNLLKQAGTNDADALFEAAQVAELSGDDKIALSRYLSYIKKKRNDKGAEARISKAVGYVMQNGQYEEAFEALVEKNGPDSAWWQLSNYANSFLNRGDIPSFIALIRFAFNPGTTPEAKANSFHNVPSVLVDLINTTNNSIGRFNKSNSQQLVEVLTSCVYPKDYPDWWGLYNTIVRFSGNAEFDARDRFRNGRRFIETNGKIPSNDEMFINPCFQYLKSRSDADSKAAIGKEILGLLPYYLKADVKDNAFGSYINLFIENADVFSSLIAPKDMAALLAQYNKGMSNSDYTRGMFYRILEKFYKFNTKDFNKKAAIEFATALLPDATPQQAAWLFNNDKEGTKNGAKGGTAATYFDAVKEGNDLRLLDDDLLTALAESQCEKYFLTGLKMHLLVKRVNPGMIADRIRKSGVSTKALAETLESVIKIQGKNKTVNAIIEALPKTISENAKIAACKGNPSAGSDAGMTAVAQMFNSEPNAAAVHDAAAAAFIASMKGSIPSEYYQCTSLREYAANVFYQMYRGTVWNDKARCEKLIRTWLPKMKPGRFLNELLQKAWGMDSDNKNHKGGLYYEMAKIALDISAKNNHAGFWDGGVIRNQLVEPADGKCLFSSYDHKGWEDVMAGYIFRNQNVFSGPYLFSQLEALLKSKDTVLYTNNVMRVTIWNYLQDRNFKYVQEVPASVWEAMLKRTVEEANAARKIDLGLEMQFLRAIKVEARKAVATKYMEWCKSRSLTRQFSAACSVLEVGVGTTDDSIAFCKTYVLPLIKSNNPAMRQVEIGWNVLSFGNWLANSNDQKITPEQKAAGKAILSDICNSILKGSVSLSPYNACNSAEVIVNYLEGFISDAQPAAINRAAIVLGSAIARDDYFNRGKNTTDKALKIMNDRKTVTPQIKYVFLNCVTSGSSNFAGEMKKQYALVMSSLAKDIPGLVPVDKNDPAFNLFLAQQMKREGNALQAWSLIREKMPLFIQRWKEFDFDFALWVVEQARKSTMYKEAIELGQTMWMDEAKLTPGDAARLGLSKGDVYRDQKAYPAAKIEYESLTNNDRYSKTQGGRMAKFRLIELLILTEDFQTARTMLERLQTARLQEDQAEAYYLQARIDYELQDDESAMQNLGEVFQRNSSHPEARLLQGQIMLRTNRLLFFELEIGQKKLATIAIPGKPIKLVIQDTNLSVIRGGKTLPVLVTTTKGNDSEIVELMPNPQDPNKFQAEVPTCLGKAKPNDLIIELCGEDEIVYQIDPKFQETNGGTNIPPNRLSVRYPAKLYASSQTILSDEEQEELKLLASLELTTGQAGHRSQSTVVRPGSPIYIRVVDHDMSLSPDQPNSLFVDISCSSGDELKHFELKETGPATGVFEGKVTTGIPFPNTIVSDVIEGIDVNAVINSTKKGSWKSLPDGKRPKWLEVDTMTSCNFTTASISMPSPSSIKSLRVLGIIDKSSDVLATYPLGNRSKEKGGLRAIVRSQNTNPSLQNLQRLFQGATEEGVLAPRAKYSREDDSKLGQRDSWAYGMISGAFYLPENREIEFKFMQKPDDRQTAHLLIDDKLLISGKMNSTGVAIKRNVALTKGVHVLKIYFQNYSKTSAIQLGMLQTDGSYDAMPSEWFNAEKNEELAKYLRPKGKITQTKDGFKLKLNEPLRYRKVRWIFEDFSGNQVEVTGATIVAIDDKTKQEKTIIPCEQDLSSGKGNNILEIAASDSITVKYEDKKRIDDNKAVLTEHLSSSFCDASIGFMYELVTMNEEGRSSTTYAKAARATKGEDIIIQVNDPDEDISENREVIKVDVTTSSGESIKLELVEKDVKTGGRGIFQESIRLGDKTDAAKRMIKVVPGDKITASFLDKENNHPGIPFVRTATIENDEGSKPAIIVYDTVIEKIEDRSPAALAKIQMMKNKAGKRAGDFKIMKDIIKATPIAEPVVEKKMKAAEGEAEEDVPLIVNSKAPLLFELVYPQKASHDQSKVKVEVLTETEINAAASERREQMPLIVSMPLTGLGSLASSKGYPVTVEKNENRTGNSLENGVFAAVVRLQLGSANDEINDLVSSNETFNLLSEDNARLDSDAFKVPTIIVSGSEKVFIFLKDDTGKELVRKTVQLRSDGELELLDKTYTSPQHEVHLGQNFYASVHDPDRDISNERDSVNVEVVSEKTKDKVTLVLSETLPHSGVFTCSLKADLLRKGEDGQNITKSNQNTIWSNFGDNVTFKYVDEVPLHSNKPVTITKVGNVLIGSDGELAAFTKKFKDPDMAVKTNFLMAEALFELAKSHKAIKGPDGKPDENKKKQAKSEIAKGKRVLEEALRDYPNTTLKAQGEFLLANLSQQLDDYKLAISQFSTVISKYPESEYAPKSYYQKAVCYEKLAAMEKEPQRKKQMGELACEEYVRLTYLYPTSTLSTDAKLRLGNYYYRMQHYRLASSVLEKFGIAHPENPFAAKALLLAGYACIRNEELKVAQAAKVKQVYKPDYTAAIRVFTIIDEHHKDNKTERAEAMYHAGESLYKTNTHEGQVKAYQFFQRLIWDYPESKWAKVARGRMAANPIKNTR